MNHRVLTANLTALQQAGSPVPLARLNAVDDGELVVDADAVVDVQLRGPEGPVRLDPVARPAVAAAQSLPPAALDASLVAVAGAGAGYAVDALIERGYTGRIVVLEPSPASCLAALSRRDWTALILAGRLRWLVGPDYDGWLGTWSWVTPGQAPAVVIHPVLGRLRPEDVRRALETIKKMVFNASANERARLQFGGRYLRHTLTNLPHVLGSRDVRELFGRFRGVPVAVLAAGPSLDRNLEELRPVRDRAVVIAVDTALRPCLAAGLPPDLVVGVDPGELNLRHLAVGSTPARTHLVAEPSLAPGSFEPFEARVFTFAVGDHDPWPWLRVQGVDRAQLRAWGSVLASALDLAVQIGGDPVVLLGADFAYTGGQPYCRNTAYEEDWARGQAEGYPLDVIWREWIRGAIEATDVTGRQVPTTPHLIAFRDWVADYCRSQSRVAIVNGTGAGLLAGVPRVDVGELLGGRAAADLSPLTAPGDAGRPMPSLGWWDGRTPPEPWTSWARTSGNEVAAMVDACGHTMTAVEQFAVSRAAGVFDGSHAGVDSASRLVEAEYWKQLKEGAAQSQDAAARRVALSPVARTSEVFYSAVCVLLRHGDVVFAHACLDDALRADFGAVVRHLLPLMAHAHQRAGDVRTSQLLFGTCDRLGLLSGRNAWAKEAAREMTVAHALHLAARRGDGLLARDLYRAYISANAPEIEDHGTSTRRPDFIVAGASACAAPLLYDFICTSPTVWTRRPREIHFFSRLVEFGLPFYAQLFEECPAGVSCGEVSPSYLDASNAEWTRQPAPDAATLMARACPATRVIVILKDPAERALDLYADNGGPVSESTLQELEARRGRAPLLTGAFVVPLRRFAEEFGRDRLLVLTLGEFDDLEKLAHRLAGFLGIVPPQPSRLGVADRKDLTRRPMAGPLYRELRDYYSPSLLALEREFGIRL